MCNQRFNSVSLPIILAVIVSVIGLLSCKDKPNDPPQPPQILLFLANPIDIEPGDSTLVTYKTRYSTSLTVDPGNIGLTPVDSGATYFKPSVPTTYHLVANNDDGIDSASLSITMTTAAADFVQFELSDNRILNGDSTQLSWNATKADSIVIDNGIGKLSNAQSGTLWLKPTATTAYTAIAYNIGTDTATATVAVENPESIDASEGLYYKGEMGSAALTPLLTFQVIDAAGGASTQAWIHFELLGGDGTLSADSILPGLAGAAYPTYNFSGSFGYADLRAKVKGVDSVDVYLRANTLIPGLGGQGQYAHFGDPYSVARGFNGNPEGVTPVGYINYVEYEQTLGVVLMVLDTVPNDVADGIEPIYGVIVNTVYDKKTADGIGVNSHISDVIAVYGQPDTSYLDPTPPAADVYHYDDPPMDFFADTADSLVFEIHFKAPLVEGSPWQGQSVVDEKTLKSTPAAPFTYRTARSLTR